MFDNRDHGFIKFLGEVPCSLEVDDVVVGKLFSLELSSIGDTFAGAVGIGPRNFIIGLRETGCDERPNRYCPISRSILRNESNSTPYDFARRPFARASCNVLSQESKVRLRPTATAK